MKKFTRSFLTSFAAIVFSTSVAYSLPDLTLNSISNTPVNLGLGQVLTITLSVGNIGTSTSGQCHVSLYVSPTTSFTNAVYLSQISLESLSAGASSNGIQFVYPVPYNVPSGTNYVLVSIDDLNEVNESDETNNDFYSTTTINVSGVAGIQKLPYPMIYIHGLIGASSTWDSLLVTFQNYYGWSFGGNMNFCLNQDGSTSSSDVANDYHDWTNVGNLYPADFYTVNFNTDQSGNTFSSGSNPLESNQAGIVKQGYAIRDAISHVLQVTGRDKVILIGHSMGGLSAREYLQNSNVWQPDGQHHVAKLFTVGTPHGGSNATFLGLGGIMGSVDELSEAVRDLRTSYYTGHVGVYLFGGNENTTDIYGFSSPFCNVDVNCNGVIFDNITGLDQKNIPTDLGFSCVIGTGSLLGGDGVVSATSADLNNYYGGSFYADTFQLEEPAPCIGCTWHQELTKQVYGNVQGIDEVNEYNQSYDVSPNQLYFGLITKQSLGGPYVTDYDDYKINMAAGNLGIKVYNIPLSQYKIDVLNSSFNSVYSVFSNGKSYMNTSTSLSAGQYYFELSGTPTDDSWFYPYAFKLSYVSTTGIDEIANANLFHGFNYPNPFNNTTTIVFSLPHADFVTIKVYNLFGQLISTITNENISDGQHEIQFDGSELSSGVYVYTIQAGQNIETYKMTISK